MIAANVPTEWVLPLVTLVVGVGITKTIAGWRKAGPEAGRIQIESATDVVVIQRGFITDLEDRLRTNRQEANEQIADLRRQLATLEQLRQRIAHLEEELREERARREAVERDRAGLQAQIAQLRNRVAELERGTT